MEVTKWLKPPDSWSRIGDRASVLDIEDPTFGGLDLGKGFRQHRLGKPVWVVRNSRKMPNSIGQLRPARRLENYPRLFPRERNPGRGTGGSNPLSSSGESRANLTRRQPLGQCGSDGGKP